MDCIYVRWATNMGFKAWNRNEIALNWVRLLNWTELSWAELNCIGLHWMAPMRFIRYQNIIWKLCWNNYCNRFDSYSEFNWMVLQVVFSLLLHVLGDDYARRNIIGKLEPSYQSSIRHSRKSINISVYNSCVWSLIGKSHKSPILHYVVSVIV